MISKKEKNKTIILMVVLGTCMHFVLELLPSGFVSTALGNIFPVNETSWEHMKMIWYPFLAAGIIHGYREKNRGYLAAFVTCAVMAMLMQIGAFTVYQSYFGSSILILDIITYVSTMIAMILMAFDFARRNWMQRFFPVWVTLAVIMTAVIIYLTYCPGAGYVFMDNEGLRNAF